MSSVLAAAIAVASGALACGCAAPEKATSVAAAARPTPVVPAAQGPIGYEVVVGPRGESLEVTLELPRGASEDFTVEDGASDFVEAVTFRDRRSARSLPVARRGQGEDGEPLGACFHVPACDAERCELRYRFDLADASRSIDDDTVASTHDGAMLGSPSTWLLHPELVSEGRSFTLRARAPTGVEFVTGFLPDPSDSSAAKGDLSDLPKAPYGVVGNVRVLHWKKGGFALDVARVPGALAVDDAALLRWVDQAGSAVLAWAGAAPIPRALVLVVPSRGHGVGFARTLGNGGASVLVPLGRDTTEAELDARWELVHELLHVSFPNLPNEQSWFEEGTATYLEPFVRARAGLTTEVEVWDRLARRLPFGVPQRSDGPLDGATSWARVYWGGALFCLLADVEIRARTGGARSLDDALRAVLAKGGNVSRRWDAAQVIEVGDAATGVPALRELYDALGRPTEAGRLPISPRAHMERGALDRVLADLGVVFRGGTVTLDDTAPRAALRRAMVGKR